MKFKKKMKPPKTLQCHSTHTTENVNSQFMYTKMKFYTLKSINQFFFHTIITFRIVYLGYNDLGNDYDAFYHAMETLNANFSNVNVNVNVIYASILHHFCRMVQLMVFVFL